MADLTPKRKIVQTPAVQFLAAASENTMQTIGGNGNFQSYFNYFEVKFKFNKNYSFVALPYLGVDCLYPLSFNAQIIDVWASHGLAGTSGQLEFDLKYSPAPGSAFTSLFTTTPKISYLAGDYTWVGLGNPALVGPAYTPPVYTPPVNTTKPVLNGAGIAQLNQYGALRCDLLNVQAAGQFAELIVRMRNI